MRRRSTRMVVLNALVCLVLKIPASINSILEFLRIVIVPSVSETLIKNPTVIFFTQLCVRALFCATFGKIANIFFLIFLSINIFFYYHFDRKFNTGYSCLFPNAKKTTASQNQQTTTAVQNKNNVKSDTVAASVAIVNTTANVKSSQESPKIQ